MQNHSPSPFSSRYLDISAIALCLFVLWGISHIKLTSIPLVNSFLNERGFSQHLTLFATTRNILAVVIASRRMVLPECYSRQLFAFSFFPIMLGLTGALRTFTYTFGILAYYIGQCPDPTVEEALSNVFTMAGLSMDNLILGIIGTLVSFGLYVQYLTRNNRSVQQSPAAYRRQSAAQAEA